MPVLPEDSLRPEARFFKRTFRAGVDREDVRIEPVQTHRVERQVGKQPDGFGAVPMVASGLFAEQDTYFRFPVRGVDVPQPDVADVQIGLVGFDAEVTAIRSLPDLIEPAPVLV